MNEAGSKEDIAVQNVRVFELVYHKYQFYLKVFVWALWLSSLFSSFSLAIPCLKVRYFLVNSNVPWYAVTLETIMVGNVQSCAYSRLFHTVDTVLRSTVYGQKS